MPRDKFLIFGAAFLRALSVGLLGVLFALYLAAGGLRASQIGVLITVGLAGNVCGTFLVGFWADHLGRRKTLVFLSTLTAVGGFGLVFFPGFLGMMVVCFLGMVNAFGRERGAVYTLEQAILPETVEARHRTKTLAWYNVVLEAGLALGSLMGGLPILFRRSFDVGNLTSYRWTFLFYGGILCLSAFLYTRLSPRIEAHNPSGEDLRGDWRKISPESKRIITRISLLFGLDSLAGGFLPGTLLVYWFFKRFGAGEETLAPIFFLGHVANALSLPVAAWISHRIGLIKTMVFAHTPSSLCLIAIPFAPNLTAALVLYLLRECLVEMELPTRQSYVMAVVRPSERTIASGVTNLTRLAAWSVSPTLAGFTMGFLSLSFPLFFAGTVKIIYDMSLFTAFRHIKPPEEQTP